MAKDNRLKKGAAPAFDESMLIGKLSGLNRNAAPATVPATPEPAPAPAEIKEPQEPETPEPIPVVAATPPLPEPVTVLAEVPAAVQPEEELNAALVTATPLTSLEGLPTPEEPQYKPAKKEIAEKKARSAKAWTYDKFFVPTPGRKTAHVYISEEKHSNIRLVLTLFGHTNRIAISDYLENVLTEHFERYEQEVRDLKIKLLGGSL